MAIISASRLWYLRHSLPIPPVVVNTKGPKCCMLNVENSSWIQTFFSRPHAYGCCGSRSLYDLAFGWQTLTSKTADRWFSQNPHAWISNLASCASLDPLSYPTVSPEMTGSVSTSLHTVLRSSASRFLGSLWHVKTNWRLKSALPVSKFYLYILFSVIGHMIKVFLVLFPVILSLLGSVQLNLT